MQNDYEDYDVINNVSWFEVDLMGNDGVGGITRASWGLYMANDNDMTMNWLKSRCSCTFWGICACELASD